jgi:putative Ca2+/H+ antiporter (TMEM165/GDT1 family)
MTVYSTVLVSEIVGDKTLYTVGALASQHRASAVLAGGAVAVGIKMLAAVTLGRVLADLPPLWVSSISAAAFVAMAASTWFGKRPSEGVEEGRQLDRVRGMRKALLGILLTEWGDFGQIAAASLVAQYGRPATVWAFASLAMLTKISGTALLGASCRRWIPQRVLRPIAATTCLLLGIAAAFRIEL